MDKNLLVMIFAPTTDENNCSRGGDEGEIGTGYPIGEDLILTSRHVVFPERRDKNHPVLLRFYSYSKEDSWQTITDKDILWEGGEELDAALIRCSFPKAAKDKGWGIIVNEKSDDGIRWHSAGFPRATRYNDKREYGSFGGKTYSMDDERNYFEVNVEDPPDSVEGWKGASGMPVFVNNKILGVVGEVPPNFNGGRLDVVPSWKMFEDEQFCSRLGLDKRKKYLDKIIKVIKKKLLSTNKKAALGSLADLLELQLIDEETTAHEVAEKLLTLRIESLFEGVCEVWAELREDDMSEEANVCAEIIYFVLPALVSPKFVEDLRGRKADKTAGLQALPAALRTVAEVIMAGVDRRSVSFRPLPTGEQWPEGEAYLPHLPDGGRDKKSEQYAKDLRKQLYDTHEPFASDELLKLCDTYLRNKFMGDEVRQRIQTEQGMDQYINNELHNQASKGSTYYFFVKISKNEATRNRQKQNVATLKQRYPYLVFLQLSEYEDDLLSEQKLYLPLRDIINNDKGMS